MNEVVKQYLDKKQAAIVEEKKRLRDEYLIENGLFNKEYIAPGYKVPDDAEYEWDAKSGTSNYYKKVAIEVTDEEFEEIKKTVDEYNEVQGTSYTEAPRNNVATALKVIAWLVYIGGFIAGIALAFVDESVEGLYRTYLKTVFSFSNAFSYWCIAFGCGTLFLGLSEIINLLNDIKNKQ